MEQELRLFRGEWPSVWLEDGWKNWKLRLVTVVLAEASALTQDAKVKYAELEFESANMAEQKSKAESRLSKLKDVTTSVYFTAKEQLEKNSVRFTWKNSLRLQSTRRGSWSMLLASVLSAGGSQAA